MGAEERKAHADISEGLTDFLSNPKSTLLTILLRVRKMPRLCWQLLGLLTSVCMYNGEGVQ